MAPRDGRSLKLLPCGAMPSVSWLCSLLGLLALLCTCLDAEMGVHRRRFDEMEALFSEDREDAFDEVTVLDWEAEHWGAEQLLSRRSYEHFDSATLQERVKKAIRRNSGNIRHWVAS